MKKKIAVSTADGDFLRNIMFGARARSLFSLLTYPSATFPRPPLLVRFSSLFHFRSRHVHVDMYLSVDISALPIKSSRFESGRTTVVLLKLVCTSYSNECCNRFIYLLPIYFIYFVISFIQILNVI